MVPDTKLLTVDNAFQLSHREIKGLHKDYLNASLANLVSLLNFNKEYTKAEGCRVWDSGGTEYIDSLGGFGALNIGHNHPRILEAIEKVKNLPNLLQTSLGGMAGVLAHNLAQITPGKLQRSLFCNIGA